MNFQTTGACFDLFFQWTGSCTISFSKEPEIHWKIICGFQHFPDVPCAGSYSGSISSICRPGTATHHGGNSTEQSMVDQLRANKMNMRIDAACCCNQTCTSMHFC